jgi:hypothetical protein
VPEYVPIIKKIKEKPEWQKRAEIYTDNVLQSVKCQQDNAFFNTMKSKYMHSNEQGSMKSIQNAPKDKK